MFKTICYNKRTEQCCFKQQHFKRLFKNQNFKQCFNRVNTNKQINKLPQIDIFIPTAPSPTCIIIIIHRLRSRRPQGFSMHDDHQQMRQSAVLALLLHYPQQSLYIIKVWSTWSTRYSFANGWNVQSISSSRLFLWHSEDVTKKFQLVVPNQMNQRHSVSHGIDGGVQNIVNVLYIQHDSVAWGSKGVDFVFHILGDHPRFTAIE